MSKYKIGDKFIVISSDMISVKVGNILEYQHDLIESYSFIASGWVINNDLTMDGFPETKLQLLEETKLKEINIKVPEGYVIDEENSSFKCIKFKKEENKEVTYWKELENIEGYWVSDISVVKQRSLSKNTFDDRNVFATKEQAEACIALAMLSQLMKDVNGDWIPDWNADNRKFIIKFFKNTIIRGWVNSTQRFLSFPTEEIRDTFLKNHEALIMKARPLL